MGEVKTEINQAIQKLGLNTDEIVVLNNEVGEATYYDCLKHFVKSGDKRWWWEDFKLPSFSFENIENPFEHLNEIIPDLSKNVWLIVEDTFEPYYPVYDVKASIIKDLLSECFLFEYYIIAKDKSWLICENHHNRMIGIGEVFQASNR